MAGSLPNLHKMDSRSACIQGMLKVKVKGHVIRALLCWHKNGFFSWENGWIATKLAHDGLQVSLHPGCSQGQGQRSRDTRTFLHSWNELLRHWRSGFTCCFYCKSYCFYYIVASYLQRSERGSCSCCYTQCPERKSLQHSRHNFQQILAYFLNSFTGTLSVKNLLYRNRLKIPPCLKYFAIHYLVKY